MERPDNSKDLHDLRGDKRFPFPEKKARRIIRDLGSLLKKMEDEKLVHRDIKPKNVVYDLDKDVVKLVDFGLACYFKDGKPFDKFSGNSEQEISQIYLQRRKGYMVRHYMQVCFA